MPNWEQNETELELRNGKCYIGYREADETSVFLTMLRVSGVFSLSPCVCVFVRSMSSDITKNGNNFSRHTINTVWGSMREREKLPEYIKGYQEINVNICGA